MRRDELARLIDHTQVRAYATQVDIAELCDEAVKYGFKNVTVNPVWTSYCVKRMRGRPVGVNPTIGFPLGANSAHVKLEEAREAIKLGAVELDMVINIGALKSGFPEFVEKEITAVVRAADQVPVKVILETSYLREEEKVLVCEMSVRAGAAFVKTSTGFGRHGATTADVSLLRDAVGGKIGVKAAGGIRSLRDALALIEAGATRIGTSAGPEIVTS